MRTGYSDALERRIEELEKELNMEREELIQAKALMGDFVRGNFSTIQASKGFFIVLGQMERFLKGTNNETK